MNRRTVYFLALFLSIFLFTRCEKEGGGWIPGVKTARTLFIYMAADNSLGQYGHDSENIDNLVKGATAANIGRGRIIVYQDPVEGKPRLLGIYAGNDGKGRMKVLKTYPEQNSAEASTFVAALADMKRYAPASNYGLALWSHGLNWLPGDGSVSLSTQGRQSEIVPYRESGPKAERIMRIPGMLTRSFAEDWDTGAGGKDTYMEVPELANAIPPGLFDFIIFDACYMGSIEVAYNLKDKADYLVASPAEVLANGMPYDLILPHLFASRPRLGAGGVAQAFYDFYSVYDPYGDGDIKYRSATIALYDCASIDALAEVMSRIVRKTEDRIPLLSVKNLQYYDRTIYPRVMYDLYGFVHALLADGDPLLAEFDRALGQVVQYKATTGRIFSMPVDPAKYSGISSYIPLASSAKLNVYYKQTPWYKRVYEQ